MQWPRAACFPVIVAWYLSLAIVGTRSAEEVIFDLDASGASNIRSSSACLLQLDRRSRNQFTPSQLANETPVGCDFNEEGCDSSEGCDFEEGCDSDEEGCDSEEEGCDSEGCESEEGCDSEEGRDSYEGCDSEEGCDSSMEEEGCDSEGRDQEKGCVSQANCDEVLAVENSPQEQVSGHNSTSTFLCPSVGKERSGKADCSTCASPNLCSEVGFEGVETEGKAHSSNEAVGKAMVTESPRSSTRDRGVVATPPRQLLGSHSMVCCPQLVSKPFLPQHRQFKAQDDWRHMALAQIAVAELAHVSLACCPSIFELPRPPEVAEPRASRFRCKSTNDCNDVHYYAGMWAMLVHFVVGDDRFSAKLLAISMRRQYLMDKLDAALANVKAKVQDKEDIPLSMLSDPLKVEVVRSVGKTSVEIFYTTQCPHCKELLNGTLRRVWENKRLRSSIDVDLHPVYPPDFCQREESGCWGTLLQLCAIDALKDSRKHVPFVMCMASFGSKAGANESSRTCGRELGLEMKDIRQCVESKKAFKLLQHAMHANNKAKGNHLPWVIVNGKHTEDDSLIAPVCNLLEKPRPEICHPLKSDDGRNSHRRRKKTHSCDEKSPCFISKP